MSARHALFLLVLAGCKVGEDYVAPELKAPPHFELAQEDADVEARWWRRFEDPTLDALVERALASNFDLRLAAARLREARAVVRISGGEARPSVDLKGAVARRETSTEVAFGQFFPPDANNFHSLGFQASWELDLFGRVARGVEAASAEYDMAVEDARATLVVVCAEVARNYVELRGLEGQIAVLRSDLDAQSDTATIVRSRVRAGLEDDFALLRIDGSIAHTRARIPELERECTAREHALATLVGEWPRSLVEWLERERTSPSAPTSLAVGLPARLLERRPDVRRAERDLARASALNAQATAELYPKFSLVGALGVESELLGDLFKSGARAWTLGPSVTTPLFRGGLLRAAIEARTAQQEQALLRLEHVAFEALSDVETALSAWTRAAERVAELELALEIRARAEVLAHDRYTNGLEDFLSVLDAQRERLATQFQLAQSGVERSTAAIAVYRALGGGWEVEDEAPALSQAR